MTRRRSSRTARDAFSASLLDMMCCGLGAAIVVFVLRQMEIDRKVERVEKMAEGMRIDAVKRVSEAEEARTEAQRIRGEAITATEQAEREERKANEIGEDIRKRQRPTVFGLPPLRGNVTVVVDRSGSMKSNGKLDVAIRSVESLVLEGMFIDRLRIVSFAMGGGELGHKVHFDAKPGQPGTDERNRAINLALGNFRDGLVAGNGTDLPMALKK